MTSAFLLKARCRIGCVLVAATLLAACGSKLTQDNFARIKQGMTQQEVTAILGEPTETSSISLGGLSGSSANWTDGKTTISIQFLNDKVQLTQFSKPSIQPVAQ